MIGEGDSRSFGKLTSNVERVIHPLEVRYRLTEQVNEPRRREEREFGVDTALEAVGRFGAQSVALRRPSDGHRVEESRLQQNLGRRLANLTYLATHNAGQAVDDVVAVHDDEVVPRVTESSSGLGQGPGHAVEGRQGLAGTGHPGAQGTPSDQVRVVGVGGLTEFEHDEIARVHHVRDGPHSRESQSASEMLRGGTDAYTTNEREGEPAAQVRGLNLDVSTLASLTGLAGGRHLGKTEGVAESGRQVARDPEEGPGVGAVALNGDIEHHVGLDAEIVEECLTRSTRGRQNQQSPVVFGES